MMNEYAFEVRLRAVVRVRASDEDVARKVVPSVLGAPGSLEIDLANQNNAGIGRLATVIEVEFAPEKSVRLLKESAETTGGDPDLAHLRSRLPLAG
jgi:hypothetical protein